MNLPEDRHPLLYVYLDNDQPERVRSRCMSQGATAVLGKWPDHLTFSWMMAVIGLVSLMICFLLAVILLILSSSTHQHGKRVLIEKCERNEHVIQRSKYEFTQSLSTINSFPNTRVRKNSFILIPPFSTNRGRRSSTWMQTNLKTDGLRQYGTSASEGNFPVKIVFDIPSLRLLNVVSKTDDDISYKVVHMKNLEDLTVNENATYFVQVYSNDTENQNSACSVESFLRHTSLPVFLVSIFPNKLQENLTICKELEKKYENFKIITFDQSSFFNKTVFANVQTQNTKILTFLAKILVSWNVGGTVIDSRVRTLKDFQEDLPVDEKSITIGAYKEDVVLISAKRFCHAYIFDVLKTIIETRNVLKYSEFEIIKAALKRFCHGKWSCSAVRLLSVPEFCGEEDVNKNCTFYVPKAVDTVFSKIGNYSWESFCPLLKASV